MKTFLISLTALSLLLLASLAGAGQCRGRVRTTEYCSNSEAPDECSFTVWKTFDPRNQSYISYSRPCGEPTLQICKNKDVSSCLSAPQCITWTTYDKQRTRYGHECRDFECSVAWDENMCNAFTKECVFDKAEGVCKDKKNKTLLEPLIDHAERATGKKLDS